MEIESLSCSKNKRIELPTRDAGELQHAESEHGSDGELPVQAASVAGRLAQDLCGAEGPRAGKLPAPSYPEIRRVCKHLQGNQ